MADIVIRGIDVSESLDIILNTCTDKVVYSTNNGMTWKEATDFIILPEGHGNLGDLDALWESYWHTTNEEVNVGSLISCTDVIIPAEGD